MVSQRPSNLYYKRVVHDDEGAAPSDDNLPEDVQPVRKRPASTVGSPSLLSPPFLENPSPTKRARPIQPNHSDDDFEILNSDGAGCPNEKPHVMQPRQLQFEEPADPSLEHFAANAAEDPNGRPRRIRRPTEKARYHDDTFYDDLDGKGQVVTGTLAQKTPPRPRPNGKPQPTLDSSVVSHPNLKDYPPGCRIIDGLVVDNEGYLVDHNALSQRSTQPPLPLLLPRGRVSYSTGSKKPVRFRTAPEVTGDDDEEFKTPTGKGKSKLEYISDDYVPETPSRRDAHSRDDSAVKKLRTMSFYEGGDANDEDLPTGQVYLADIDARFATKRAIHAPLSLSPAVPLPISGPLHSFIQPNRPQSAAAPYAAIGNAPSINSHPRAVPIGNVSLTNSSSSNLPPSMSNSSAVAAAVAEAVAPHVPATGDTYTLESRDSTRDVTNCPDDFCVVNEDGSTSPAEVPIEVFTALQGNGKETFLCFIIFRTLAPFVSAGRIPSKISLKKGLFVWPNDKSVIFAIPGSVVSCSVVNPATIGSFEHREIRIVPYGNQMRSLLSFVGPIMKRKLKIPGQVIYGPFDFGCILTISGRRSGIFANEIATSSTAKAPIGIKKSMFTSSRRGTASDWFEAKLPNCVDFDKQIPLYDATVKPFHFERSDFAEMPHMPLYQEGGSLANLPANSAVIVFFSLASWHDKKAQDCLSFNLQYVVNLGTPVLED